ncbi:hypothetical protein [Aquirufa rosea]|uniref:Uncharacterized protein n=1 Tax=Aquirufa rosea TaxID=2509241 RepID=A0A4Q1BY21_9BACT|nr:hypothetical protein [Aquirufa rosea]RXK47509.1 hypothetical protein ESB04_09715 [Aquirufa rosea]
MKKSIISAIVGGLIIFFWQAASHVAFNLHEPSQMYTSNQDSILTTLNQHLKKEGGYILPRMENEQDMAQAEAFAKSVTGKPWARIQYYTNYQISMQDNMIRGLLVDIFLVFLVIYLIKQLKVARMRDILSLCLIVAIIVFTNGAYTEHIWYPIFDLRAQLIDLIVAWGLCGIWLGWYMPKKSA